METMMKQCVTKLTLCVWKFASLTVGGRASDKLMIKRHVFLLELSLIRTRVKDRICGNNVGMIFTLDIGEIVSPMYGRFTKKWTNKGQTKKIFQRYGFWLEIRAVWLCNQIQVGTPIMTILTWGSQNRNWEKLWSSVAPRWLGWDIWTMSRRWWSVKHCIFVLA